MEKRHLGKGGPLVSALGIGAMSFADFYGATDEAASHAILDAALEAGVDHLDTSNVYGMGKSENAIGSWLARRKGEVPFKLATKGSITKDAEGRRAFDNSRAHLTAELDGSLKRMGVDHVDLYYIHRRDTRFEIEEVAETMAGFVKAGKIGAVGFSEIAPRSLRRAMAVHPVAAVQSEYSLATRQPEMGLVQACEDLGVALVAFSPVGRALLTDTPPDAARVEASSFMNGNPRFSDGNLERNVAATAALRDLAADMGVPTAALAIAWFLAKSPVTIPIPGTRSVSHFKELVQGTEMTLSSGDIAEIERRLPIGWAHGARYTPDQFIGPEHYC